MGGKRTNPNAGHEVQWSIGYQASRGEHSWQSVTKTSFNGCATFSPPPKPAFAKGHGNVSNNLFRAQHSRNVIDQRYTTQTQSTHCKEFSASHKGYMRTKPIKQDTQNSSVMALGVKRNPNDLRTSAMDSTKDPRSIPKTAPSPRFQPRSDLGYNFAGLAFDGRVVKQTRVPGAKLNFDKCLASSDKSVQYNIINGRTEPSHPVVVPPPRDTRRPPLNSLVALRPHLPGDDEFLRLKTTNQHAE